MSHVFCSKTIPFLCRSRLMTLEKFFNIFKHHLLLLGIMALYFPPYFTGLLWRLDNGREKMYMVRWRETERRQSNAALRENWERGVQQTTAVDVREVKGIWSSHEKLKKVANYWLGLQIIALLCEWACSYSTSAPDYFYDLQQKTYSLLLYFSHL